MILPTPTRSKKRQTFASKTYRTALHVPKMMSQVDRLIGKPIPPSRSLPNFAVKDDLKAFGFTPERVGELMEKKEREVDACTQIPNGAAAQRKHERAQEAEYFINRETRERQRRNKEKNSPEGKKMGRGYEPLPIQGTENWVLLDVLRGFPPTLASPPPEIFVRLSRYVPGQKKIIAYNAKSNSVGLRKTPKNFEGCTVEYHKNGPKLVSTLDQKLIKKQDAKAAVEPEEPSPPSEKRRAEPGVELDNIDAAKKSSPPKRRRGKNAQSEVQKADITANFAEKEAAKQPSPPRKRWAKTDAQSEVQNDDKPAVDGNENIKKASPTSKKRRFTTSSEEETVINDDDDAEKPSPPKKRRGRVAARLEAQEVATTANHADKKPSPPRKRRAKANDESDVQGTSATDLIVDNAQKISPLAKERLSLLNAQGELAPEIDGNAKEPLSPKKLRSPSNIQADLPLGDEGNAKKASPSRKRRTPAATKPDAPKMDTQGTADGDNVTVRSTSQKKPSPPRRGKHKSNDLHKDMEAGTEYPASDASPAKKRRSARLSAETEIKKESEEATDPAVAIPASE